MVGLFHPHKGRGRTETRKSGIGRVLNWLTGGESSPQSSAPPSESKPRKRRNLFAEARPPEPVRVWPEHRLRVIQFLWGSDCIMPGGVDYVLEMVRPLGLTSAMSMVDLSAGLGGPDRAMANKWGVWITGLEVDKELAELGMKKSTAEKLEKKVKIQTYDPATVELRKGAFDCVYARELFHTVEDKNRLLSAIKAGLKPNGSLLFTDYVRVQSGEAVVSGEKWGCAENKQPQFWTLRETTDCLAHLDFDVRIAEDVSDEYRAVVLNGWLEFVKQLKRDDLDDKMGKAVLSECEKWMSRLAALQAGEVRLYRFHALSRQKVV